MLSFLKLSLIRHKIHDNWTCRPYRIILSNWKKPCYILTLAGPFFILSRSWKNIKIHKAKKLSVDKLWKHRWKTLEH